jgi:NADH:ubiquinone oxidoreductase subunit 3 (subunit A)
MTDPLQQFQNIVPYAMGIGTLIFGITLVTIPYFISPRHRGAKRDLTYESGEPIIGEAWIQFHSFYYIYALVFMGFDVETAWSYSACRSCTPCEKAFWSGNNSL